MRHGSLFTGYGGLDLAVAAVFPGSQIVWVCDNAAAAGKVLAHRYPGVPNLGDVTTIDWTTVEPVEILTGGYPCQPFSKGGRRKGTDDDRHLWPYVRDAIRHLRPRVTILENVSAHRSLGFNRVCGDMAEDGLRVQWVSLRASDVGAPHERERIFIVATDPDNLPQRLVPVGPRQPESVQRRQREADHSPTRHGVAKSHGRPPSSNLDRWGECAPAIDRWERTLGRLVPDPVLDADDRINPAVPEWMMGLPEGWVTQVPGLSHSAMHETLGNGVVPQQAVEAITELGRRW